MATEGVESKLVIDGTGMKRYLTNPFDAETMRDVAEAAALIASVPGPTVADRRNFLGASRLLMIHAERVQLWQHAPLAKQ